MSACDIYYSEKKKKAKKKKKGLVRKAENFVFSIADEFSLSQK